MSDTYRNRTRAVRGAAREHLRRLRAERLSRRATCGADAEGDARDEERARAVDGGLSISAAAASACSGAAFGRERVDGSVSWRAEDGAAPGEDAAIMPVAPSAEDDRDQGALPASLDGGGGQVDPCVAGSGDASSGDASSGDVSPSDAGSGKAAPGETDADPTLTANRRAGEAGLENGPAQAAPRSAEAGRTGIGRAATELEGREDAEAGGSGRAAPITAATEPALPDAAKPGDAARARQAGAAPEAAETARRSDLHSLPGAGPGLVWMLEQCGIASLDDLARTDPDTLTDRMGLVGQMLDLRGWIAFAADGGSRSTTEPARRG